MKTMTTEAVYYKENKYWTLQMGKFKVFLNRLTPEIQSSQSLK